MAPQLAWVGLGNMGRGMCKNLVEKGNLTQKLLVYNRTTKRASDLVAKIGHAEVSTSLADLVSKADIIFYCLGDDAAVLDTVDELLKSDVTGKILVDCSTIHPDSTEKEAEKIKAKKGSFVACPVFGAPAAADAGQLVCVLAGEASSVEKIKPYCEGVMGRAIIDYSDLPPAKATLLKVLGNTFIASMVETLSEGHVVAEKSGLGTKQLHQFIETMFPGPYTAYSNRMLSGDYYQREEPLFAVDLARKDARHAQAIAKEAGMTMKNVQLADSLLVAVKEHMGARGDIAGMYGAKRKESGLPFENQQ
ncbi:putative oxido YfjR [Cyphellophora attinorum]|uniref:Putative oxido YfjR n=1 Tax=Cyphellophora attinorum TaxID=1664694 RepID=A0A0N1HZE8_9EURO|nr:putative oxido YfjR [Phialophora attinorum]KPI44145.1 putative oxido YfjR [Phialophora attinorum]